MDREGEARGEDGEKGLSCECGGWVVGKGGGKGRRENIDDSILVQQRLSASNIQFVNPSAGKSTPQSS